VMPVADQFWGDRYGILEDPWGHSWSIATPGERQLSPEEIAENMKNMAPA
jgi:PhnB protein